MFRYLDKSRDDNPIGIDGIISFVKPTELRMTRKLMNHLMSVCAELQTHIVTDHKMVCM